MSHAAGVFAARGRDGAQRSVRGVRLEVENAADALSFNGGRRSACYSVTAPHRPSVRGAQKTGGHVRSNPRYHHGSRIRPCTPETHPLHSPRLLAADVSLPPPSPTPGSPRLAGVATTPVTCRNSN